MEAEYRATKVGVEVQLRGERDQLVQEVDRLRVAL